MGFNTAVVLRAQTGALVLRKFKIRPVFLNIKETYPNTWRDTPGAGRGRQEAQLQLPAAFTQ